MSAEDANVLTKTASEDSWLTQLKQLPPDAQRVIHILENSINEVEITVFLPAVLQDIALLSVVDKEFIAALHEHPKLAKELKALDDSKKEPHVEEEGEAGAAKGRAKAALDEDIKNSFRNVLRFFRANPNVVSAFEGNSNIEAVENENLLRSLDMFHFNVREKFLISLEDDQQLSSYEDHIAKLEKLARIAKEQPAKTPGEKIKRYSQGQAKPPEEDTPTDTSTDATNQQIEQQAKAFSMKQMSMQQEIDQLDKQLYCLMQENRLAESILEEENEKMEMEIADLLKRFDDKMEDIQANLELNAEIYEKEDEEVKKLEEPFSIVEAEYNQVQERRRLAGKMKQEEVAEPVVGEDVPEMS